MPLTEGFAVGKRAWSAKQGHLEKQKRNRHVRAQFNQNHDKNDGRLMSGFGGGAGQNRK
jgi:hypothetical protein